MLFQYEKDNIISCEQATQQEENAILKKKAGLDTKPPSLSLNSFCMEMMTSVTPSPYSIKPDLQHNIQINACTPEVFPLFGMSPLPIPTPLTSDKSRTDPYQNYGPIEPNSALSFSPFPTPPTTKNPQMFFPSHSQSLPSAPKSKFSTQITKKSIAKKRRSRKKCRGIYCTCDLSESSADLANYMFKKSNLKFVIELQSFHYEICEKRTEVTKKRTFEFVCKFNGDCNMRFGRSWNLLDHCRMHYGIKPFQCEECGRSFTQRGNLNKHKLTHI
ncbi:unnamed protein product [Moneuplotes crassus]|uniref:C2H2-type domain-containing protein n=1 Tax=Euplotes crassus TaxID=5936 RepID=A0AAD1X4T7_EUPCR|nr:unnamed protein product [Moneuplotes crassus]